VAITYSPRSVRRHPLVDAAIRLRRGPAFPFFSPAAARRDESRFAQRPSQILETRDFVTSSWVGEARTKPVGNHWLKPHRPTPVLAIGRAIRSDPISCHWRRRFWPPWHPFAATHSAGERIRTRRGRILRRGFFGPVGTAESEARSLKPISVPSASHLHSAFDHHGASSQGARAPGPAGAGV